ncbi:MAG: LysM peptidoglycan-binding domain-containing protein [Bdellovibrionaceae bacterium]|nr:LysM peptidoglycan-binding domain-containing protein [Pseudobdellovibrionaceae bacterium]
MNKIFLLLVLLFGVGCAHTRSQIKSNNDLPPDESLMSSGDEELPATQEDFVEGPEDMEPIKVGRSTAQAGDLSDTEADINNLPAEFNAEVKEWIDYFQGRGRKHMLRYLGRSTRYIPKMKEILKSHGLPEDLVYLALIESGFNGRAVSSARASGYWQFMRGTARHYGLRIDYYTDERSDFVASTEAAAQYLKALYHLFGSWYLAIASYNVGENRVKSLVMKHYTRDFWELARLKKLPRETVHYIPKFIAARMIGKHPEKYGFTDVEWAPPLDYQEIKYEKSVSLVTLSQRLGLNYEDLKGLNSGFKRGIIPKYGGEVVVRVPSSLNKDQVLAALDGSSTPVAVARAVTASDTEFTNYRVRSGDTLSTIARKFRVTLAALIEVNDLTRKSVLHVGKRLRIPRKGDNSSSNAQEDGNPKASLRASKPFKNAYAKATRVSSSRKVAAVKATAKITKKKYHVVRTGDTLLNIASKYNVRLSKLISHNKLRSSERILIGSHIAIPH